MENPQSAWCEAETTFYHYVFARVKHGSVFDTPTLWTEGASIQPLPVWKTSQRTTREVWFCRLSHKLKGHLMKASPCPLSLSHRFDLESNFLQHDVGAAQFHLLWPSLLRTNHITADLYWSSLLYNRAAINLLRLLQSYETPVVRLTLLEGNSSRETLCRSSFFPPWFKKGCGTSNKET